MSGLLTPVTDLTGNPKDPTDHSEISAGAHSAGADLTTASVFRYTIGPRSAEQV